MDHASHHRNDAPAIHDHPTRWAAEHIASIATQSVTTAPLITSEDVTRIAPNVDIWDAWPIQRDDGVPAQIGDGTTLWMALGAPRFDDPDERHGHARIHLLAFSEGGWRHLGPAMPDRFSPGSREWSGSAVLDDDDKTVTLYFTVTGRRDEAMLTFEQRIFEARADLNRDGGVLRLEQWRDLREAVARDAHYMASDAGVGAVGTIKAFRDPAYFRDPSDGRRYLFFAGSRAGAVEKYNGVVGTAIADATGTADWKTLPPLLDATGVNNELERPHVVYFAGRYYLFWSTQGHVFDPAGPVGPAGLYGAVSDDIAGPWTLLNGSGLAFANPESAPKQAYSWLVLPDLRVISFVDDWGHIRDRPRRFGATFAPVLQLTLEGTRAGLTT